MLQQGATASTKTVSMSLNPTVGLLALPGLRQNLTHTIFSPFKTATTKSIKSRQASAISYSQKPLRKKALFSRPISMRMHSFPIPQFLNSSPGSTFGSDGIFPLASSPFTMHGTSGIKSSIFPMPDAAGRLTKIWRSP